jgi:formiminotetrahydrofolate cyclodeaminase
MVKEQAIGPFLDALASKASTPGGGSAAAIMGAMGAALVSMVGNLTIGKQKYADVEADMETMVAHAEGLRESLTEAVKADIQVFAAVMAAYGLPKDRDEQKAARSATLQQALKEATDVPLDCARLCAEVIALSRTAAEKGNSNVASDAGVAVLAAHAALRSAALNVYINVGSIKDADFVSDRLATLEALMDANAAATEEVYGKVKAALGG